MDRPAPGIFKGANLEAACHSEAPIHWDTIICWLTTSSLLCALLGRAPVPSTALSAALHRDIDKDDLAFQPLTAHLGPGLLPTGYLCPASVRPGHRGGPV
jgi:hypothetical protein